MSTYKSWAPLWSGIVDSSIWDESDNVFRVFMAMLALKDFDHVVRLTAYQLAKRTRRTEIEILDALKVLSSPDSRRLEDQEFHGRRIQAVEEGWLILNGAKYRDMVQLELRRARNRRSQQAFRDRKKGGGVPLPGETSVVKAFEDGRIDEHEQPIPAPPGPEPDLEMPTKPTETEKKDVKFFKRVHLRGTKET